MWYHFHLGTTPQSYLEDGRLFAAGLILTSVHIVHMRKRIWWGGARYGGMLRDNCTLPVSHDTRHSKDEALAGCRHPWILMPSWLDSEDVLLWCCTITPQEFSSVFYPAIPKVNRGLKWGGQSGSHLCSPVLLSGRPSTVIAVGWSWPGPDSYGKSWQIHTTLE